MLNQIDKDGIFFTLGDFQLNICWYLQFCKGFRNDISVILLSLMNRPFFVLEMKNSKLFTPINIEVSNEQIMDMQSFKWNETTIDIPISKDLVN